MIRQASAPDTEPEDSRFLLPSEKEHYLQIINISDSKIDPDVIINKVEVVGGDEEGRSFLHRINVNDKLKSFYYCRMFLKAISEPYKGTFKIIPENWIGRRFHATVIHKENGKYANIKEYIFKDVEQQEKPKDIGWES